MATPSSALPLGPALPPPLSSFISPLHVGYGPHAPPSFASALSLPFATLLSPSMFSCHLRATFIYLLLKKKEKGGKEGKETPVSPALASLVQSQPPFSCGHPRMSPLPATMQAPHDLTCRREEADARRGGQLRGIRVRAHWGQALQGVHPAFLRLGWGRRRRPPQDAARAGPRVWDKPGPESLLSVAHEGPRAHCPEPPAQAPRRGTRGMPIYQARYTPAPDRMVDPSILQDSLFTVILNCLWEKEASTLLTSSASPQLKADRRWPAHFLSAIVY